MSSLLPHRSIDHYLQHIDTCRTSPNGCGDHVYKLPVIEESRATEWSQLEYTEWYYEVMLD